MKKKLPIKLEAEPLIDAVFEVRFISLFPASSILPGLLFSRLEGDKTIDSLPAAQLPKQFRDSDPNMQFAPLSRIDWSDFYINIGDQSLSIGIKHPYPGWNKFQTAIIKGVEIIKDSNIIGAIERYSLKYIDLIPSVSLKDQVSFINSDITLAGHKLEKEAFQLRIEIPKDGFINAVQVISSAKAIIHTGELLDGLVVDVDTISNQKFASIEDLLIDFEEKLSTIHRVNKEIFFDCLTDTTIQLLRPIYE
ncbi:MAG: hypothetical protein RLZ75_1124 [Pseudomonadota bacterium]|jgi:uncharacterized protein (TIGR04255 family)